MENFLKQQEKIGKFDEVKMINSCSNTNFPKYWEIHNF